MPRKTSGTAGNTAAAVKSTVKKPQIKTVKTEPIGTEPVVQEDREEAKRPYHVKSTLTPSTFVTVKNGFNGKLVFRSSRTNERFVWEQFGDEQDMELQDLKNAKNAHKAFFENNWFLFDDPEVIHYLGVDRLYASSMDSSEFDELFTKTPEEIIARISTIPDGQKQSLIYLAKRLITEGRIDSMKMVNALEESLGCELIER